MYHFIMDNWATHGVYTVSEYLSENKKSSFVISSTVKFTFCVIISVCPMVEVALIDEGPVNTSFAKV